MQAHRFVPQDIKHNVSAQNVSVSFWYLKFGQVNQFKLFSIVTVKMRNKIILGKKKNTEIIATMAKPGNKHTHLAQIMFYTRSFLRSSE